MATLKMPAWAERVFESIHGAEDLDVVPLAAKRRTVQALTLPHPKSTRRHSGLAGPSIPLNAARSSSQKRATQIFSWLRKLTFPRTLWLQRRSGCDRKDGGRALRRRSSCRRSMASGSTTKQTARSKGSVGGHGCSAVAAWPACAARWCRRQRHRAVQGAHARNVPQWYCSRRGTGFSQFTCTPGLVSLRKTGKS